MKVLFVTPYYPTIERPYVSPFIERLFYGLQKEIDIELYHFVAKRKWSNYLKARKEIKRLIKENNYDLIHINWGQTIAVIPFFVQSKIVVSFRGSDVYGVLNSKGKHNYISKMVQWVSHFAAKRSDANIYVSKAIKSFFKSKKVEAVIPSGCDIQYVPKKSKDEIRTKLGFRKDELVILFVGNTKNVGKRFIMAQNVVNELALDHPEIRFVQVWGKTPKEVFEYMTASDFLFQTSLQEGSPNVVKEALACNLAVVSTPVGDTQERIGHLEGCYIAKDLSELAFKSVAVQAISNFERDRINDYRQEVYSYSLEQEIANVLSVYNQVIA